MMKSLYVALAAMAVATACASNEPKSFDAINGDYTKATDEQLCGIYGFRANGADKARKELTKRGVFSAAEWANIDARKIEPGMPECAVAAVAFMRYAKVEGSGGQMSNGWSVNRNYIYSCKDSAVPHCPYTQVTVQKGVVTSVTPRAAL